MTHCVAASLKHGLQLFRSCDISEMELNARRHVGASAIELVVYDGDGMTIGQKPAA